MLYMHTARIIYGIMADIVRKKMIIFAFVSISYILSKNNIIKVKKNFMEQVTKKSVYRKIENR